MKGQKTGLLVLAMVLLQVGAMAQQGTFKLDLGYQVALPTGNTKNISDHASGRGFSGALLYEVNSQLSVGVAMGFQDFYQKYPRQVYHGAGTDLSAVISNSVQTMPLMLKGKYRFTPSGPVQPFVGLGVGGNLVQYQKYYGQFMESYSRFGFAAQPEVGLQVPVGRYKNAGLHIAAGYNIMPFSYGDADGLHHAVLKAGFSIPLR